MIMLINNLTDKNHMSYLAELSQGASEILLVSPFLFEDFSKLFDKINLTETKVIELITTLRRKSDDQLKKPQQLTSFIQNVKRANHEAVCKIHINNKLHGKIYIFKYPNGDEKGIVSSANLTDSGLNRNHEWGLLVQDQDILKQLRAEVMGAIDYKDVSRDLITGKMVLFAEQAIRKLPKQEIAEYPDIDLIKLLKEYVPSEKEPRDLSSDLANARGFFLTPIGDSERPILVKDKQKFGNHKELRFSKKKFRKTSPKDIFISFGTGSRSILCINTALTGIEESPKKMQEMDSDIARWPQFIISHNHTPKFGDRWWDYNITIYQLKDEYLSRNPKETIAFSDKDSLKTFNQGADRLKITKGFAEFICQKIQQIENKL